MFGFIEDINPINVSRQRKKGNHEYTPPFFHIDNALLGLVHGKASPTS
jgi:hypothetical protein